MAKMQVAADQVANKAVEKSGYGIGYSLEAVTNSKPVVAMLKAFGHKKEVFVSGIDAGRSAYYGNKEVKVEPVVVAVATPEGVVA
jgi:hypothetical protein